MSIFGFFNALVFSGFLAVAGLSWGFGHAVREGLIEMEDIVLTTPGRGTTL